MPDDNKKHEKIEIVDLGKSKEQAQSAIEKKIDLPLSLETLANVPEQAEVGAEKSETNIEKEGAGGLESASGSIIQTGIASQKQKEQEKEIEKVLEADLEEAFLKMSSEKRLEFELKGVETAQEINTLFEQGKATAKKVIDLIKKWLALIPGVNKFFLEQEAKIKADEIIKKRNQQNNI